MKQKETYGVKNKALNNRLFDKTSEGKKEGRLVDMNKMTQQYYFHPNMKDKTSVEKILPAICIHQNYLQELEHYKTILRWF